MGKLTVKKDKLKVTNKRPRYAISDITDNGRSLTSTESAANSAADAQSSSTTNRLNISFNE